MTHKTLNACLIMHSTRSDNLGVGALTVSGIEILRKVARDVGCDLEITIFDWTGTRAPYVHGNDLRIIDLDGRSMINPKGYLASARKADLVIDIGGGDSFADIYGGRRLNRVFLLKALTHLAGTPLVVAPQTIGPFTKPASRRLATASLKRSAIVASRDAMSTKAAREMGIADVLEASDVALRLPYDPPAPRPEGGPVKVGINVSGLLMNGGYTGKNEFGLTSDYPELMRDLVRHFQSRSEGCEVHLVPHVLPEHGARTHGEDDYAANEILAKEFPGVVEAPRFQSPSEAKSYIAGLDFFMGARMHACIAAFSSGVPVVPMAYSRKFAGLFGTLGYDHTVDCTSETREAILAKVIAAFEDRATLETQRAAALKEGLKKLDRYSEALRDLMVRL